MEVLFSMIAHIMSAIASVLWCRSEKRGDSNES